MKNKERLGNSPFPENLGGEMVLRMESEDPSPMNDYRNRVSSADSFGEQISPQKQLITGELYGDLPGLQTPFLKKDSLEIRRDDQSMLIFRGLSGRFTNANGSNQEVLIGCIFLFVALLSTSCMVPVMGHIRLPLTHKLIARNLLVFRVLLSPGEPHSVSRALRRVKPELDLHADTLPRRKASEVFGSLSRNSIGMDVLRSVLGQLHEYNRCSALRKLSSDLFAPLQMVPQ
jgi:hypothetical protein